MQNKNMLASFLFFFVGFVSMAQGSTPPPPMPPPPPGLPIDGGIVVLFIVALGYGIYKAYKLSKPVS
ncbi:PID-CTERM protein-sorting domain-containing protein [Winogradskyella pulchriflava]|uniref:PID-CTERM protein-sorting domain-containing protein n=1 Tax=Winogradskyella pulchriflava TaxID=1110688 RepID=A0ABV6Q6G1_9FLAO